MLSPEAAPLACAALSSSTCILRNPTQSFNKRLHVSLMHLKTFPAPQFHDSTIAPARVFFVLFFPFCFFLEKRAGQGASVPERLQECWRSPDSISSAVHRRKENGGGRGTKGKTGCHEGESLGRPRRFICRRGWRCAANPADAWCSSAGFFVFPSAVFKAARAIFDGTLGTYGVSRLLQCDADA